MSPCARRPRSSMGSAREGPPADGEGIPRCRRRPRCRSPIVTWGDGTGGTPEDTAVFLRHLATWGFTVIAVDLKNTGSGRDMDTAARFLVRQNSNAFSWYYHRLNPNAVGAVGFSQG